MREAGEKGEGEEREDKERERKGGEGVVPVRGGDSPVSGVGVPIAT